MNGINIRKPLEEYYKDFDNNEVKLTSWLSKMLLKKTKLEEQHKARYHSGVKTMLSYPAYLTYVEKCFAAGFDPVCYRSHNQFIRSMNKETVRYLLDNKKSVKIKGVGTYDTKIYNAMSNYGKMVNFISVTMGRKTSKMARRYSFKVNNAVRCVTRFYSQRGDDLTEKNYIHINSRL